jgi:hypothetical protein
MTSAVGNPWDRDPMFAEPEAPPPHSQVCLTHGKRYRGACPWCSCIANGGKMPLEDGENRRLHTIVGRHQPKPEHAEKFKAAVVLRRKGLSLYKIAKTIGVAVSTVHSWTLEDQP